MTWQRAAGIGALAVVCVAAVAWTLVALLFDGYHVPSEANAPTLQPGDRVLARSVGEGDLRRGDLVVYTPPPGELDVPGDDAPVEHVARVVAIAGDSVAAEGGSLVIDGDPVDEPYLPEGATLEGFDSLEVPEGHVFLLGDARDRAMDSRVFGTVPVEDVRARMVARWWPLTRIGGI